MKKYDWSGKRVLITGSTSGLGLALAKSLLKQGAKVAGVSRTGAPGRFHIQGDVSKKGDIYRISGEAIAALGGVDVLVNNASYLGAAPLRSLLDTECEDFEKVLETNVLGLFRLTRAILPSMLAQRSGLIVNITSDASVSAYPTWGAYGTSKAAVDHLSRIWQEELEGRGIRIVSVDPGDMDTPMHRLAIPNADASKLRRPELSAELLLKLIESESYGGKVRHSL